MFLDLSRNVSKDLLQGILLKRQRFCLRSSCQLDEWLAAESFDPAEKISAVRAIYDAVGIRRVCEEKIESLFAQALSSLDTLSVDADLTGPLRDFAHHLMGRQS